MTDRPEVMYEGTEIVSDEQFQERWKETRNGYKGRGGRDIVVECESYLHFERITKSIGEYNCFNPKSLNDTMSLAWDQFDGVWVGFEASPVLYLSIKESAYSLGFLVPEVFVDLVYHET